MARLDGETERRVAVVVVTIDAGAALDEMHAADHRAASGGLVQGSAPASVGGVDVGAGDAQRQQGRQLDRIHLIVVLLPASRDHAITLLDGVPIS